MRFFDDLDSFIGGLDGKIIGGDCFGAYDEKHKRKVKELLEKDNRYYYLIQIRCGIDPDDESYYGPDTDIRIVNVDHFAIKGELKDKLEEFRQLVYNVIDEVYEHQDDIDLDKEVWDYEEDW